MKSFHLKYKKILHVLGIVAFVAIIFIVGAFVGSTKSISHLLNPSKEVVTDSTPSSTSDLSEFWSVWNLIQKTYPFTDTAPTDQKKIYGAISGMVASYGDPYTEFFPPQQAKLFSDQVAGSFGGIGTEINSNNGVLIIISPIKGSPAATAGLKSGDVITSINGTKTFNMDIDTAISEIRGAVGTMVTLGIEHPNETAQTYTITRQIVSLPIVDTVTHGDIFEITLSEFSKDSANLFKNALQEFKTSGKQKLIIDLRGNPGGYLDSAVDMASYFLPNGATVVQEDSGSGTPRVIDTSKGYTLLNPIPKIAILVDGGSASAAEIFSGALSEGNVATLVGTQTFGKGSVQEVTNLPDGSAVKITIAKWLTPNGTSISGKGIAPKIIVPQQPTADPKTGVVTDPQLDAAIKLLDK